MDFRENSSGKTKQTTWFTFLLLISRREAVQFRWMHPAIMLLILFPDVNTSLSLLEQDDENAAIQLVSVSGNGRVVGSLVDSSYRTSPDNAYRQYSAKSPQNGQKVAEGTYDYRLTSGTNNDEQASVMA